MMSRAHIYVSRLCAGGKLSIFRSAVTLPRHSLSTSLHRATIPATLVPEPHGIHPLSLLDEMSGGAGVVKGWVVEGTLDLKVISAALDRLVAKWPLLAGRLEHVRDDPRSKYQIRFPAGAYPKGYAAYTLTSSDSTAPISDFFTLPLPVVSEPPPISLFIDSSTPRSASAWISRQHPLTCWHVTRFPPAHDGKRYTCVGVSFSHKAFDGMGSAVFIRGLEAEMLGRDWTPPPPLLHEGRNVNVLRESLDAALDKVSESGKLDSGHGLITYKAVTPATIRRVLKFAGWHAWQKLWHKAKQRIVILPPGAVAALVNRTRKELEKASGKTDVRLSTGDIIVAWFFKTVYSDGTPASKIVSCSSMASGRPLFPQSLNLDRYPHNCFFPLPYPTFSVGELQSSPLYAIAHSFAVARSSMSISHPLTLYNLQACKDKKIVTLLPCHPDAQETLTVSNTSATRTIDLNWTGAGEKTTLCQYVSIHGERVFMTNLLLLSVRMHDGGTQAVLDVVLNERRLARLEASVQELLNNME